MIGHCGPILVAMVAGVGSLLGTPRCRPTPCEASSWQTTLTPVPYALEFFTVDPAGRVLGAGDRTLYRITESGDDIESIHTFTALIQGLHVLRDGTLIVSTDPDRWDPRQPCRLYRSVDNGRTFKLIKTIREGCALWWSLASDRQGNLYVGEYGPRGQNQSKGVWKTSDQGNTWKKIFQAPNVDGVHVHRVAVDPYTDFVWVTYGDRQYQGTYLSQDAGTTWTRIRTAQSTSVAFTKEAIFWGEDTANGVVTRYDRKTRRFETVLDASQKGPYGGSVYSMAVGRSGQLFVPMMKYAEQSHVPTLWVGRGSDWHLLLRLASRPGVGGGFQHIGGPDKNGYLYVKGYRIEETPPYPANRLVTHPTVQALLGEEDATRPEESVCPGPVAVGSAVADQEEEVFSTQEAVVVQPAEPGDGGMILNANFPNPFNARTEIRFVLSEDGPVDLSFFNLAGQKVATLIEEVGVVGVYTVVWDGNDDEGRELASGIYLYRLTTSTGKMTRKLLLLR